MNKTAADLTQNVLYCHHNDLLDDDAGKAILDIFEAGVCDDFVAGMFEHRNIETSVSPGIPRPNDFQIALNYHRGIMCWGLERTTRNSALPFSSSTPTA